MTASRRPCAAALLAGLTVLAALVFSSSVGHAQSPEVDRTVEVPSDWSLIPSGLGVGDSFRLLFLSSTKRNGESTDIADYNGFVQGRAAVGHADIRDHSSRFRAVACTSSPSSTPHVPNFPLVTGPMIPHHPSVQRCSASRPKLIVVSSKSARAWSVIQQPVPHGPHHDLLLRGNAQLYLNGVDGVSDGNHLDFPCLRNRNV